jgi:hypothetical protein
MASKDKEVRLAQRTHWENKLNQRLSALADKGLEPQRIAKDPAVRSIRGKIRKTEARLAAIADLEKKVDQMARIRAEKVAVPKKEKGKKKVEPKETQVKSKRQQKKEKKTSEG